MGGLIRSDSGEVVSPMRDRAVTKQAMQVYDEVRRAGMKNDGALDRKASFMTHLLATYTAKAAIAAVIAAAVLGGTPGVTNAVAVTGNSPKTTAPLAKPTIGTSERATTTSSVNLRPCVNLSSSTCNSVVTLPANTDFVMRCYRDSSSAAGGVHLEPLVPGLVARQRPRGLRPQQLPA